MHGSVIKDFVRDVDIYLNIMVAKKQHSEKIEMRKSLPLFKLLGG